MRKTAFTICCLALLLSCGNKRRAMIEARAGVLDLRESLQAGTPAWDFERDGTLELNGEWEIYWQQLLDPTDFQKHGAPRPSAFVRIPGRWNGREFNGVKTSGIGYATYRLKILLPGKSFIQNELMALRCRYQQTSYRIFWNGVAVAANGTVAATKEAYKPEYRPITAKIPSTSTGEVEIIVQIANFAHRYGGFSIPLELGMAPTLTAYTRTRQLTEAFLLGAVFLMAAYFFGLFISRTQDPAPAWFAICCLAIFFRILVTGDRLAMQVFPDADWVILLRVEYLSFIVADLSGLMYLKKLFVQETVKSIHNFILICLALLGIPVIFFPPAIFTHTLLYAQILIIVTLAYAFYVSVRAILNRREGAQAIFLGFVLLAMTTVNDIVYNQLLIGPGYLAPYGIFALVLTHSVALSRRLAAAFGQTENLKENLEIQVELRTIELKEAITIAQQATEAKSAFFAMMTHELRTPLNGIIGMSNILKLTSLTDEQKKYLGIIHNSGSNLMSVINDILDFSLIDAGKLSLNKTEFSLAECAEEIMALGRTLIKDKPVELTLAPMPADLPKKIIGDQARIKQTVINLVSNAVKFTERGYVHLSCSLLERKDNIYQVEFSVEDTGIGISEKDQENLFKPYTQADQSIARRYGGTGLGLVISSRIVEAMGGTMHLNSMPGKGSCFFFSIPLEAPVGDTPTPAPIAVSADLGSDFAVRYPLQILAVEDDVVNQVVITESLRVMGYRISMAENARQALELVAQNSFDLILMDVQMPEISGIEATEQIRKLPQGGNITIIALTADSSVENQRKCFEAGMDDFLMKPFNLPALQAMLMKWAKGRR